MVDKVMQIPPQMQPPPLVSPPPMESFDDGEAEYEGPHDHNADQGLAALRDPPDGQKPFYPYSTLIRYAIKGSPESRLLLEDIYAAIEKRFPYFTTAPAGWKNSVRHNLSLNPCFEKVARPLTDRGKGAYWTVNDRVDPKSSSHRDRKKKRRRGSEGSTGDSAGRSGQQLHIPGAPPGAIPGSPGMVPAGMVPGAGVAGPSGTNGMPLPGQPIMLPPGAEVPKDGAMPFMAPLFDAEGNRIAFAAWPGFGQGGFPMMAAGGNMKYVLDPNEDELTPEFDEDGQPIWRTIWLNELVKLRRATYEQDSTTANPEWYRAMVERVRAAFLQPEGYMEEGEEQDEHSREEQVAPQ
ncbi:uncharacterized protein EI90DRAFT_2989351 [Cantharellus anzutake]|uniref:uncharacterized protein n=1 Tax=Cantharellus anzutake TaxID=1750568 RepID=UPI0019057C7C|nr:uncharacterized protein EI90DRAFT_2989351 [Cantharellus anzutake]KAF8341546.1 hypothetical protein EI90DRAFT_2989351 [Cantharellus anzutake]